MARRASLASACAAALLLFTAAPVSLNLLSAGAGVAAPAVSLTGLWDATVQLKDGSPVPFKLQLAASGRAAKATFFDGQRPVNASTGGSFRNGQLHIDFASYASKLDAQLDGGVLRGTLGGMPFEARPHQAPHTSGKAPSIAGVWEVPVDTAKGEKAWRLIVKQGPTGVYATILRIDGDTGTISGVYDRGAFHLSRYAGERPTTLVITPQPDNTLGLTLVDFSGKRDLKALRPAAARQAGLAAPTDPTKHTAVRDWKETFHYSGVDLAGRTVTNADPRFHGKVVLVNIMGSWCPNCHDEAPFLAALDAKYRSRGLQIVGLDFESPDQLQSLDRLKAFIARYNLRYNILVGGERSQVNDRLPQAVNLNAWPTTFFIGRDGKPRSVHVGFPSHGSGQYDVQARAEISHEIETLLAEKS